MSLLIVASLKRTWEQYHRSSLHWYKVSHLTEQPTKGSHQLKKIKFYEKVFALGASYLPGKARFGHLASLWVRTITRLVL